MSSAGAVPGQTKLAKGSARHAHQNRPPQAQAKAKAKDQIQSLKRCGQTAGSF